MKRIYDRNVNMDDGLSKLMYAQSFWNRNISP